MSDRLRCPRIYAHGTHLLLRFAGQVEVASRVGIDPAELTKPDGSIPVVSHYDAIEAAVDATGDPLLGLHFGMVDMADSRPGAGAIGMLYFSSPNLRVSIQKLIEHQSSWNPGERLDMSEHGDNFYLRYRCWGPYRPAHDQHALRNAAAIIGIRKLVEEDFALRHVRLEMQRPREGADEIEKVLECPVEYEAGINEFVWPRAVLDIPLPGADPELFRYCEQLLREEKAKSLDPPSYTVLTRTEIEKGGLNQTDDLSVGVSKRLGCSARTLQRRLAEEGTTLQELIDEARRERGLELLRVGTGLREIAFELGYAEPASFRRAFRRWYGRNPSSWRDDFGGTVADTSADHGTTPEARRRESDE